MSTRKSKIIHLKNECKDTFLENELFDLLAEWIEESDFEKFYTEITLKYGIMRELEDPSFTFDGLTDE